MKSNDDQSSTRAALDLNEGNSGDVFVEKDPDGGIEDERLEGTEKVEPLELDLLNPQNKLSPENKGMLLGSLGRIENSAGIISTIIRDLGYAPPWAESKIYVAADNMDSVADYMQQETNDLEDMELELSIEYRVDYGLKSNASAAMNSLPESTQKALKKKGKDHNDQYGDKPAKRLPQVNFLAVCYYRGIGAYNENPSSVRPNVSSAEQWAMARVNGLLYALKNGKFKRSPYDVDLLPDEHPDAPKSASIRHLLNGYSRLPLAPKGADWGWDQSEADRVLGDPEDMDRYERAFLFVNKGETSDPAGYKLPVAKMIDGELQLVFRGVITAGTVLRGDQSKAGFNSGYYNLDGATEKDKLDMYSRVERLYSRFGEKAPPYKAEESRSCERCGLGDDCECHWGDRSFCDACECDPCDCGYGSIRDYALRAVGDVDPTNFPSAGEDKKVSLRNSEYPLFDREFAARIKAEYPTIWDRGGNILGNKQYNRLVPIAENNGEVETRTEEEAVRLREAWAARHFEDFRLAGVIAQVKWLVIGSRGEKYMKDLIREEMAKEDRTVEERAEPITSCPIPTKNLKLNAQNKAIAKEQYQYQLAQGENQCGNCRFFDVREGVRDCIRDGLAAQGIDLTEDELAQRGYCRALDFTCGSSKWCNQYVEGGPIQDDGRADGAGTAQPDKDPNAQFSQGDPMNENDIDIESATVTVSADENGLPNKEELIDAVLETVADRAAGCCPPEQLAEPTATEDDESDSDTEEVPEQQLSAAPEQATPEQEEHLSAMPAPQHKEAEDFKVLSVKRGGAGKVYSIEGQQRAFFGLKDLSVRAVYEDGSEATNADERARMGRPPKFYNIEGIASSTSVDHYGTEMTYKALSLMQQQFEYGVPVLPRHQSLLSDGMAEWDEVIGRTESAEIRMMNPQDMKNAYDYGENQYILAVKSRLYGDDPKARELVRRLDRGEPIGQSIGGWFNKLEVMENAEGEVTRVLVEDVSLDHLAITRAPANPDSYGLASIRSVIGGFTTEALSAMQKVPADMQRHIAEIVDEGGQLVIRFNKTEEFEGIFFEEMGVKKEMDGHLEEERSEPTVAESDIPEKIADTEKDNTKRNIDHPNLDNCVIVEQDNIERAERTTSHPEEEYIMKEQDFAKIAELMRSAIAPIAERVDRLENTTEAPETVVETRAAAPTAQPEKYVDTEEISALKAELERTRSMLDTVMAEPVRIGRHQTTQIRGIGSTGAYSDLITRSRNDGAVALATVAEKNIEVLANESTVNVASRSQHDLIDLLAKGLRAAELDGLLGTKQVTNWN